MTAGNLRDRVTVESQSDVDDGYGNTKDGWGNPRTFWADIRERTGKEKIDAGVLASMRMATVRVRKNSTTEAVTPSDRIFMRGVHWNIISISQVDPKGGRRPSHLELLCEFGSAV